MFSVPLICSSSGVATVSAMVAGLAPGNCAVTTTDGGTTSGYSEIGNCSHGDQARQEDGDGNHPGEDRPVDEEFRQVHVSFSPGQAGVVD